VFVRPLVAECKSKDGFVVCHETLGVENYNDDCDEDGQETVRSNVLAPDGSQAVCRGSADAYDPTILQLARRIWRVIEV
jgi:hypothetical protein